MNSFLKITLFLFVISFSTGLTAISQESSTKYEVVQIETAYGNIVIWLYDQTPKHKANFISLTKEGYFDGTTFHRIIKGFVIQGGDPNSKDTIAENDGNGGPDYTVEAEFVPTLSHVYGAIGAAREGDNINPQKRSSGSQFYIVVNKNGTPHLNGGYTVFGQVISGMEVAEKIADQPKAARDRPVQNITMKNVMVYCYTKEELLEKYNFVLLN